MLPLKMPQSIIQLSSDGLKELENDIAEFSVDEGVKLMKAAKEYLKVSIFNVYYVVILTTHTEYTGGNQTYSDPHAHKWHWHHPVLFSGSGQGCRGSTQMAARVEGEVEKREGVYISLLCLHSNCPDIIWSMLANPTQSTLGSSCDRKAVRTLPFLHQVNPLIHVVQGLALKEMWTRKRQMPKNLWQNIPDRVPTTLSISISSCC